MLFFVPASKLSKLQKLINKYSKKLGSTIKMSEPVKAVATRKNGNKDIHISGYNVDVTGQYKINGWEVIAQLEHTPNGNMIRRIDFNNDVVIPEYYRTAKLQCDHCHCNRERTVTYIIYNGKEFKQIGSSCLNDYTNGCDVYYCKSLVAFEEEMKNLDVYDDEVMIKDLSTSANLAKNICYEIVKEKGYVSDKFANQYAEFKLNQYDYNLNHEEIIKEIDCWVKKLDRTNEYYYNACLVWESSYVENRNIKFIGSLINAYLKEQQTINGINNNYVGNIGDKINIDIKSIRLLYKAYNRYDGYNYDEANVYEIIGSNDNVFTIKTTLDLSSAKQIKATIKNYKTFRNVKQTVLTRAKVVC